MEAIRFGDRDELLAKAKEHKYVYGEKGLGGAHLFYVSSISPITDLGLPSSPSVPASVYLWKEPVRYLGWLGFLGAIAASGYQYIVWRRRQLEGGKDERKEK
jgi:formate dehydrogenase iron-sulfur subunit